VSIQLWFKSLGEKMGVHLSPHTLRHTFAAHLAQKGMPQESIQALLGHENPKHTHIYTRLYSHAQKQMYDEWM
jgi:site-specific recombinase XerD